MEKHQEKGIKVKKQGKAKLVSFEGGQTNIIRKPQNMVFLMHLLKK